jgi:hypothetical protein
MKIRTKKTVDFANQWVKDDLIVRFSYDIRDDTISATYIFADTIPDNIVKRSALPISYR